MYDDEGILSLQIAVIDQARKDYITMGCGGTVKGESQSSLRRWLKSELSALYRGSADPNAIIANWDIQTRYQQWRKKKHCTKCKMRPDKCIHKGGEGNYTARKYCMMEGDHETERDRTST